MVIALFLSSATACSTVCRDYALRGRASRNVIESKKTTQRGKINFAGVGKK